MDINTTTISNPSQSPHRIKKCLVIMSLASEGTKFPLSEEWSFKQFLFVLFTFFLYNVTLEALEFNWKIPCTIPSWRVVCVPELLTTQRVCVPYLHSRQITHENPSHTKNENENPSSPHKRTISNSNHQKTKKGMKTQYVVLLRQCPLLDCLLMAKIRKNNNTMDGGRYCI